MQAQSQARPYISVAFALILSLSLVVSGYGSAGEQLEVRVRDDCEPASFNAAIGAGTCSETFGGDTTFDGFIAQLMKDKKAGAWRFSPNKVALKVGDTLILVSRGGETHTFTKVAEFGGGFIIPLNLLSDNPTPRSECTTGAIVIPEQVLEAQPPSPTNVFVLSGITSPPIVAGGLVLPPGTTLFQCCVHPWMRIAVTVES